MVTQIVVGGQTAPDGWGGDFHGDCHQLIENREDRPGTRGQTRLVF